MLPLDRVCTAQGLATSSSHSNLLLYKGPVLSPETGHLQSLMLLLTLFTDTNPAPSVYFFLPLGNSPSPQKALLSPEKENRI